MLWYTVSSMISWGVYAFYSHRPTSYMICLSNLARNTFCIKSIGGSGHAGYHSAWHRRHTAPAGARPGGCLHHGGRLQPAAGLRRGHPDCRAPGRGQYFPHGHHSADPLPRGPHFRPARHLADDGRPGPHCPPRHGWATGLDGCGAHLLRRGRTAAVRTTAERTAGLQRRV